MRPSYRASSSRSFRALRPRGRLPAKGSDACRQSSRKPRPSASASRLIASPDTTLANLGCKQWSKPVPPEPHCLVVDVDPSLVQKVLNISKRKRKPDIHHHGQADDLGAGAKVPEGARFCHPTRLACHQNPLNSFALTMPFRARLRHRRHTCGCWCL